MSLGVEKTTATTSTYTKRNHDELNRLFGIYESQFGFYRTKKKIIKTNQANGQTDRLMNGRTDGHTREH